MTKWCIEHRSIVAVLSLFIILSGVYVYIEMERQENPDVVSPGATVKTIYPGATPEDVERLIVKPLEDKINEIPNIKLMTSYSLDNVGVIIVRLKDLTDEQITETWNKLKDKVDEVQLPDGAYDPEVDTELVDTYGMLFTISGDDYKYKDLKVVADELQERIEKIDGVARVEIDGHIKDEIHIDLDLLRMRNFKIPMNTIGMALKARNINIPGGSLKLQQSNIPITTTGEYNDINDIKNTIVGMSEAGNIIYLKDIANITEQEGERDIYVSGNGEKALLLTLKYSEGENIVKIGEKIRKSLKEYEKTLPSGMNLNIITDQSEYVNDAIKDFEGNLIAAILLVVVVVFLTMGSRSAIVVSSAIPITVMATFVFMKFFGIILHQVSIASLIVCLGLLVSNAIVANDNMDLHLSQGKERKVAITDGIKEVRIAILTSTLTTVASFLPLAMMKGVAGKFVKDLPVMVTIALMSSYLISLTVVPAMGYTFLKEKKKEEVSTKKRKILANKLGEAFLKFYELFLDQTLKKPRTTILIAVGVLALTSLLIPSLGLQLFPFVERDQYIIDVTLAEGTTVEKTHEIIQDIEALLLEDPSVTNFLSKVGDGIPKFYPSFFGNQIASNKGQFVVNGEIAQIENVQRKLNENIPGARIEVKQLENAIPVELPVQVRVTGKDVDVLKDISNQIKEILYTIEEGQHVQDDYGSKTLKMTIDVNQDKASMVGLTNYDISSTVRMAVNGLEMTKLRPDNSDDDVPVILRIPSEQRKNVDMLNNIFITSQITGKNVPINQIAEIKSEFNLNRIIRRNRDRTITVGFHPKSGHSAAEVLKIVEERMKDFEVPEGYSYEFGGENEDRVEAFESLVAPSILAIVLVYLILMFQFFDLRQPLIIMGTIPLSFIGVILGLKITGFPLGFMALNGVVSLMGVVVNNGIVLLDYINILKRTGMETLDAVKTASMARLRPITIGMVTTVIGLVPMGIRGGSLWAPLAYTIIFGLMVSSVLTVLVIPASFIVFESKKAKRKAIEAQ
ncbi:efflux RND transporter permease subunit [Tissierella praeacuta]|uniref:efflux RND transporter permease subunit n=1 Tax=Tissierella praeacuta TaxID=43131 RepID=UPI003511EED5